jgi:hypothetical protein
MKDFSKRSGDHENDKIEEFNHCTAVYLVAETIARNDIYNKNEVISFLDFVHGLQKMAIQTSHSSNTNYLNQFSTTFDPYFKPFMTPIKLKYFAQFGVSDPLE